MIRENIFNAIKTWIKAKERENEEGDTNKENEKNKTK